MQARDSLEELKVEKTNPTHSSSPHQDYFPEISSFFPIGMVQMTCNAIYRNLPSLDSIQKRLMSPDAYALKTKKDEFILLTMYDRAKNDSSNVAWIQVAPKWLASITGGWVPHRVYVVTGSNQNIMAVASYGEQNQDSQARSLFPNVPKIIGRPVLVNWIGEKALKERGLLSKSIADIKEVHQVTQYFFEKIMSTWNPDISFQDQIAYVGINVLGRCMAGIPEIPLSSIPKLRRAGQVLVQPEPKANDVKEAADIVSEMAKNVFEKHTDHILAAKKFPFDDLISSGFQSKDPNAIKEELERRRSIAIIIADGNLTFTMMSVLAQLSENPDVVMRLRDEQSKFKSEQKDLNTEQLRSFPYLDCVYKEILRYIASVPVIARYVSKSATLHLKDKNNKEYDLLLPAHSVISTVLRTRHLDPAIWTNPRKFDPSRFEYDPKDTKAKAAVEALLTQWAPFSMGRRACIAQVAFTEMVIKTVINLSLKYDLKLNKPVEEVPLHTMEPFWKNVYHATVTPLSKQEVNIQNTVQTGLKSRR